MPNNKESVTFWLYVNKQTSLSLCRNILRVVGLSLPCSSLLCCFGKCNSVNKANHRYRKLTQEGRQLSEAVISRRKYFHALVPGLPSAHPKACKSPASNDIQFGSHYRAYTENLWLFIFLIRLCILGWLRLLRGEIYNAVFAVFYLLEANTCGGWGCAVILDGGAVFLSTLRLSRL